MQTVAEDSSHNGSSPALKRRKRLSSSCTSCRSRKIKCDHNRPCSNCIKKKIERFCIYDPSPFKPEAEQAHSENEALQILQEENKLLKEQIEELKNSSKLNASISLSLGNDIEPTEEFGLDYTLPNKGCAVIKTDRLVYFGPTSWRSLIGQDKKQDLFESTKSHLSNYRREWKIQRNLKKSLNKIPKDVQGSTPKELLDSLSQYLPSYDIVRGHLNYYTKSFFYEDIPIIDQNILIKDFLQIVSKTDDHSNKCKFNITNKTIDYSRIALIIIVLKYVSLTLNLATTDYNYDTDANLLIRYAERLLDYSKFFIKSSIPTLQTLILLHHFKRLSPVDGDGGDGSNGLLTFKMAINMAIAMGLHRDIDVIYSTQSKSARIQMKQIWKFLVKQDTYLSFHLGLPLTIDSSSYIIESPEDQIIILMRNLIKTIIGFDKCSRNDLLKAIKDLENFDDKGLSKLSSRIKKLKTPSDILKMTKLISSLREQIIGLYMLHSSYEFLLVNSRDDDEWKEYFRNAVIKFGVLCLTHLIELLERLNIACKKLATETISAVISSGNIASEAYELLNIVNISSSFMAVSVIIFIKVFPTIWSLEIDTVNDSTDNDGINIAIPPADVQFRLTVDDIEQSNPMDKSDSLNESIKLPLFLHSLMTLGAKHLVKLQTDSFERVHNLHFCIFTVVELYKYLDHILSDKLKLSKTSAAASIIYMDSTSDCSSADKKDDSKNIIQTRSVNLQENDISSTMFENVPSLTNSIDGFNFFDFKNDNIDRMFQSIIENDSIFDSALSNIFPNIGTNSSDDWADLNIQSNLNDIYSEDLDSQLPN
ncbi:hypothetical protein WICMUC_001135 [Wickerhamomyces mucosus]|uniref:Zn(2)-C6 fungal-type domain-containing protein n=1 Tax=Wickerhamomyces mucosus TaxID=1378264 RepID=A0A9P8PX75_9ASCO|nr:hypothetical protein WICMUC_001135 [Wickerhamomyces mucosus]